MKTTETYITFGVGYTNDERFPETVHPQGMSGKGYATIQAPSRNGAREIANVLFGQKFAFDYDTKPRAEYVPEGELLRVAILQRNQLQQAREVLAAAGQAAEGGSNDEEIDALIAVRDVLAEMIGEIDD